MKDLGIIIPAHDEERTIRQVVERVRNVCSQATIIVVNDASSDGTAIIAQETGVEVLNTTTSLNYGGALKIGFHYLAERKPFISYVGFLDADGTYPPERFPELYNSCSKAGFDMTVGSRFLRENVGMPFLRKIGNKLFAVLLSFYSGIKTSDSSTGMRVFNLNLLPIIDPLPSGLDFATAMTTKILFSKMKYFEIPIEYYKREGKSKLRAISDGYRFLRIIMIAAREYSPAKFYCSLGIPFLLIEYLYKTAKI